MAIKTKKFGLAVEDIETRYDIGVDAKPGGIMIFANATGRKIVEDLWPEVQWSTDAKFALSFPLDWRFTHIRVTELPPHLEAVVPLTQANQRSLGMAVAQALQHRARRRRVFHFVDSDDPKMPGIEMYDVSGRPSLLRVEYIPPNSDGQLSH